MSAAKGTIVYFRGRTGQRIAVERDAEGRLLAVHLKRADGTFERLEQCPQWLRRGLYTQRQAKRMARLTRAA